MGFPNPFYQQNLPSHAVTVYLCLRGQATKKNPVFEETGQGTAICILIGKKAFYDAGRSCLPTKRRIPTQPEGQNIGFLRLGKF